MTYGSPMANESPALSEGTSPSEPTRAAAPSLNGITFIRQSAYSQVKRIKVNSRDDVTVEVGRNGHVKDSVPENPPCE